MISIVTFLPVLGGALLFCVDRRRETAIKHLAFGASLVTFLVSLGLYQGFRLDVPGPQFTEQTLWIGWLGVEYHVGVDGISLLLVLLTTFLSAVAILSSYSAITTSVKEYMICMLLLETGMVGVFVALDLVLFYVFWEGMLIPMYFLIGIWGHERRVYAAVKFFLYTMAGSVLMLAGIIYLYNRAGTFDYTVLTEMMWTGKLTLGRVEQAALFLGFFAAFAIKVPLFPLHTWLPDAHVEAPTAGSVMLASVMLKMGCYGLLRFCLPMFPAAARGYAPWIAILAIVGILYGALVALVQPNMKKLVAYTSVSHLGFVVLGIFSFTELGVNGAVYQMLSHGISTGALFILVGFLYERRHSLEIKDYGGVATPAPALATMFLSTSLASMGLPMLNNFVGEYLVLQGTAQVNFRWAVFAAIGVILSACYMLWLYQRVFFGETPASVRPHMRDSSAREWAAMAPLLVLMVWMGTFTQTFMPPIATAGASILEKTKVNVEFQVKRPPPPLEVAHAR